MSRSKCNATRLVDTRTACSKTSTFKRNTMKRYEIVTTYSWLIFVQRFSRSPRCSTFNAYSHTRAISCHLFQP